MSETIKCFQCGEDVPENTVHQCRTATGSAVVYHTQDRAQDIDFRGVMGKLLQIFEPVPLEEAFPLGYVKNPPMKRARKKKP